MTVNCWVP